MEKMIKVLLVVAFLLTTASSALAETEKKASKDEKGLYLGANFLVPVNPVLMDYNGGTRVQTLWGLGLEGSIGYSFETKTNKVSPRIELAASFSDIAIASVTTALSTTELSEFSTKLFLNAYLDLFRYVYIGGGVGVSFTSYNIEDSSTGIDMDVLSTSAFAANVAAGFNFPVSKSVTINLGFRTEFLGSTDLIIGRAHYVSSLGVRYTF